MKKRTFAHRIVPMLLVFSFLGVLFAGSDLSESENRLCKISSDTKITVREVSRIAQGVCSEELLPSKNAKITHSDTTRP